MEKQMDMGKIGRGLLKGWLTGAAVTALLMLVFTLVMYLTNMGSSGIRIGVYVIYIAAGLVSGWMAGRSIGSRKFLWGLAAGLLYYLTVCVLSALSGGMSESGFTIQVTTMLMCLGSGMLGGMLG